MHRVLTPASAVVKLQDRVAEALYLNVQVRYEDVLYRGCSTGGSVLQPCLRCQQGAPGTSDVKWLSVDFLY